MKSSSVSRRLFVAATFLAAMVFAAEAPAPAAKPDPWKAVRPLLGKWVGDVSGAPGAGKTEREYVFTLNNRFIQVTNKSIYWPQEKNKRGETHEDLGFVSYDKAAKK